MGRDHRARAAEDTGFTDPVPVMTRFFVVPHTHWDREWYRPFEHFRLELAGVVDGVTEVLEGDPDFPTFTLDGQAIVLEDYLEVRPENEGRLRALLSSGRLEVGPSYVLPDEFLVGAEPLVRNLLMGRAVCERFGGKPSSVGYLPDSFGHPAQMPQLLEGFGIRNFIFSRGLGDQIDEVGVIFRWRSPDGSEVLAFQQLPHYANFADLSGVEDAERRVRDIVGRFGSELERAGVDDVLLSNGSDHRPVNPELPRLCAELEHRFPGSEFRIVTYYDYVRAVGPVEVPAWTGELLGSRLQNVLRGVNSARLYIKQANERAEQRLLAVETLAALRALRDRTFPGADFRLAWRDLLRCHPHDTICGCSCDEVHRDALVRYESLDRTLSVLQSRALQGVAGEDGGLGVFNPLPYRRRGVVEPAGAEPVLVELEGFAARTFEVVPARPRSAHAGSAIESDAFRVEAAEDGTLTVIDKQCGRRLQGVHALEDELDMGDLYNFCPVDGDQRWRGEGASIRVLADRPLVSELELRVEAERPVGLGESETRPLSITTVVRLVQGSRRVEFRTTVDNATRDHRLRVVFPVGAAAGPVRAEGQFALLERQLDPAPPRTEWVEPPDTEGHTAGAVALGTIAIVSKGLPEYEARTSEGHAELCLTLLRCVGIIAKPPGLSARPQGAGPPLITPEGQCLGRHECEYALLTHAGALSDVALLRESQDYRCGFLTVPSPIELDAPLELDGEVIFSCLKGAEDGDGLILRCFNPSSSPATARTSGDVTVSATRLDETGEKPLPDGGLRLKPHGIATLRVRPR
jgi:2-O-(6-phospho-alpha-D-mannosyl)-D-glycerate hydrolase